MSAVYIVERNIKDIELQDKLNELSSGGAVIDTILYACHDPKNTYYNIVWRSN